LNLYFQAGVHIRGIETDVDHTHVQFAAPAGYTWELQAADSISGEAGWSTVGTPVSGDDYFHETSDNHPVGGQRFYRLRATAP
jgi:hypothetical protein